MPRPARSLAAALVALPLLGLGACTVAPPAGPTVFATPPQGKDGTTFQREDYDCRVYAQAAIGGQTPQQAATSSAIGSAAIGTALGAAAGALIGSAGAAAGTGAAVGAGAGLLAGSAIGASTAQASGTNMQVAYDNAYAQCMQARGNTVQAGVIAPPAVGYYAAPAPVPYYGYYAPPPVPNVTIGLGVYRGGWGWGGGYRPWYYGRPYYGGWGGGYRPYGYGWRRW